MDTLRLVVIIIGLALNLSFNLIGSKEIFKENKKNKNNYLLIWLLTAFLLILSSYETKETANIQNYIYGIVGLSFPQFGLALITTDTYRSKYLVSEQKLTEVGAQHEKKITEICKKYEKELEELGKKYDILARSSAISLAMMDIISIKKDEKTGINKKGNMRTIIEVF